MGIRIYPGNKLEMLAETFRKQIYCNTRGKSLFTPETVVVQTQGIGLYLRHYLGRNGAIAANLETPFLNKFFLDTLPALLPEQDAAFFRRNSEMFQPEILKWKIHEELLHHAEDYPEVLHYIGNDRHLLHQLSAKLADLYDNYIWYRFSRICDWSKNRNANMHWEQKLYLALTENGRICPSRGFDKLFNLETPAHPEQLPDRISLFGIGSMPPLMLKFFQVLAKFTEIHLFYLTPCAEYWGDLFSTFQLRKEARENNLLEPPVQIHNPILADLGMYGMEFFENTIPLMDGQEEGLFREKQPDSMLEQVQQDILFSINRTLPENQLENPIPADQSISIHNCHNKRREVEVLHDQLLRAIEELKISANDIIVMAPDINEYASLIESVFSQGELAGAYNISDKTLADISSAAEGFCRILAMNAKRGTVSEIMAILATPALRETFDLDDDTIARLEQLIRDANIRWGMDSSTREEFSEVAFSEYSWREGLDRLLLSAVAEESDLEKFATPTAPAGNCPQGILPALGNLAFITRKIFQWRTQFNQPGKPEKWLALFNEIIDTLFGKAVSRKKEVDALRHSLLNWGKTLAKAQFSDELSIQTVKQEINAILSCRRDSRKYLSGGITFCSLVPMRSIPAKVIAILGLTSANFPRKESNSTLNIFPERCRGDRSRLLEDRYLFLESIMAAEKRLLLFYTGQENAKGMKQTPSAPLAVLRAYLEKCFDFKVTGHTRQAFSPKYFDASDERYFSYSKGNAELAENFRKTAKVEGLLSQELFHSCVPDEPHFSIQISDLCWTLYYPAKTFVCTTTKLPLGSAVHNEYQDEENTECVFSTRQIIDLFKAGDSGLDDFKEELIRQRQLPPLDAGENSFQKTYSKLLLTIPEDKRRQILESEEQLIDIFLDDPETGETCRIYGFIRRNQQSGNQFFITPRPGNSNYINCYISFLCNIIQSGKPGTLPDWFYDGKTCTEMPLTNFQEGISVEIAKEHLLDLIQLAKRARTELLPFFPSAGFVLAQTGDPAKAGETFSSYDAARPFCQSFFGDRLNGDLMPELHELARNIYFPWFNFAPDNSNLQEES